MKMNRISKALRLLVLVTLLVGAVISTVSAQATPVAASSVAGSLVDVGSKHYLGLKVLDPSKPVSIAMDYRQDSSDLDNNSGFFVFDETGFQRFVSGTSGLQSNLAMGALDSRSGLKQKVAIINNPVGTFSVVPFNEAGTGLDYTLTVTNALIVDDSGEQVRNASAPVADAAPAETATEAAPAAPAAVAPAATEEVATATATATPAVRTAETPAITRSESLQGELVEQFSKHYYDLAVNDIGSSVNVTLSYDPQDQADVDNGFNVYVYSTEQFQQLIRSGDTPSIAANTAAGTLTRVDGAKTMRATINKPFKMYTVIVGNDASIPVSYTVSVDNGLFVDASGQSNTAKMGKTAATTTTATTAATVAATGATTTTVKADPKAVAGEIYVVQAGDTIATIARAAYGDVNLWDELCAFNQLANCDRIEVGQKITVPAKTDLGSGAVAAPVATVAAPVAATTATTPTTATAPITSTVPVTTTTTPPAATGSGTIIDVATNARQFEILLLALSLSNLTEELKGAGPFTLFAPADAAFASLPNTTLDSLLADTAQLARVLQFHIVPQQLTTATITDGMTVDTLMGQKLTFAVAGGKITVNGANVVASELPAGNGSVFTIDGVLLPAQ